MAVRPADVETRGVLVTTTGGPGTAGLALANRITGAMAPAITDYYDVVFLDQRGTGGSEPVDCDGAAAAYALSGLDPSDGAHVDGFAAASKTFVADCISEAGISPDDLAYYSSAQAAEDLEAIRQHLNADALHLYGQGYGTAVVQTYAAAHPDRVAMLILDGVVDLTIDPLQSDLEASRALDDGLESVLRDCNVDETCARDVGGDALTAYDELAGRLADGPITFDFPMFDGTTEQRAFTAADFETAAGAFVDSLGDRMLFQRALAMAVSGNLVPLARLLYRAASVSAERLDAVPDLTRSAGAAYAIECQDRAYLPLLASTRQRLQGWVDAAAAGSVDDLRLGSSFYADLPCLYWPVQPPAGPLPGLIVEASYPTLVLTASTDSRTPAADAVRVFTRIERSSLVILNNGPHIGFGRGFECVDDVVTDALVNDRPPPIDVTVCDSDVADPYVAIAPVSADAYADGRTVADIVADQITTSVDYVYWDQAAVLNVGCDFGGSLTYLPAVGATQLTLRDCEFTDGVPVSGHGSIDDESGMAELEVAVPTP